MGRKFIEQDRAEFPLAMVSMAVICSTVLVIV